ncbi:ribosome recycling factor [Halobacteroides halobius DSM 5150]|uniref:Ribosome-recycling factor n=1 Tax=Halobacteroides halobius (strain ATCC 35273 / DSM 5150 / MD-1) TaxID=748449 RepID=L0K6K7_HALHC|nr:ribosome recycling factor [Halobacteroides halobius]AGB40661.1 ribosome recycling factor [Halobacteroides halobius DSM 5150]
MIKGVMNDTRKKMEEVLESIEGNFAKIRTGRARPSLVEDIKAEYYGQVTPLNQMAQISVPEARQLVINPYDNNALEDIEKAILKSDLDLTPNTDGDLIRINIPELTEERRKKLAKLADEKAEEGRIAIREVRREANNELEDLESSGEISEDNYHRGLDNVQQITDEYINKVDTLLDKKKSAIMSV